MRCGSCTMLESSSQSRPGRDDPVEELARARLATGALKICSGGPCSRITPASRKQTRLAMSRAKAHLVGRDQHRHPALGELADHAQHLGDELGVERARHLVEQHQRGLHRERAHDRDALLLAAREPVGVLVALVGEPEAVEQLGRLRLGLLPAECRAPCAARA